MKRYVLFLLVPLLLFTGCVKESPEPLYTPETVIPEIRESVTTRESDGIIYEFFNDHTCEIIEADSDVRGSATLTLVSYFDDYPVVAISDGVFQGAALTQVILPEKLERIGARAFEGTPISRLILPDTVKKIGEEVFSGCNKLETLKLSPALEQIPIGAFYGCRSLTELVIPEGVTVIGEEAFGDSIALEKVTLPESLVEIDPYAFWHCGTDALEFSIPAGVKKIGFAAFDDTAWLEGNTEEWLIVGEGVLLRYNGIQKAVTVPDTVRYLSNAFDASSVVDLTLPDTLQGAAENALANTRITQIRYDGKKEEILSLLKP